MLAPSRRHDLDLYRVQNLGYLLASSENQAAHNISTSYAGRHRMERDSGAPAVYQRQLSRSCDASEAATIADLGRSVGPLVIYLPSDARSVG
jgi:hypothetical protein